jgi:hypothetical protein
VRIPEHAKWLIRKQPVRDYPGRSVTGIVLLSYLSEIPEPAFSSEDTGKWKGFMVQKGDTR